MPLSIRARLMVLALVPITLLTIVLQVAQVSKVESLVDHQLESVRTDFAEAKRTELKNYMDLAYGSIKDIYDNGGSFEDALPILKNLTFGDGGYIFGYTEKGDRLVMGKTTAGVGDNFWSLQDKQGNYLIQGIFNAAKNGDGYYTYWFPKLNETEPSPKTSYSIYLDRWKVFLGTGFYFDDVDAAIANLESKEAEQLESMLTSMVIIALVALGAAFIFGFLLSRSINRPLDDVSKSVAKLAEGEADLTARLNVSDRHELGQLAERLNTFIGNLGSLIGQVKSISSEVGNTSEHIVQQTKLVSTLVSDQDHETDQVATAVTQMTAAAAEISKNAVEAAEAANASDEQAKEIRQTVTAAAAEVNALANDIVESTDQVQALGQGVIEISSVLDVIKSIAEQTNLLALNAAIEAARAGEQGRGFAVVADEVRGLASKTQQSTEEISKMIERLETSSKAAVEGMVKSRERGVTALSKANEGVESIASIVQSVAVITQMNEQIASASEQQTAVCEEISQRLVHISDKANEASNVGKETNHSAEEMVAQSGTLFHLVERFKT